MHKLTLQASLDAVNGLLLVGALPIPPGFSEIRMHDRGANGMRPWLRVALGDEAARDLEGRGTANHHIGALMGIEPDARWQELDTDPGERDAIRILDSLAESVRSSPVWSFLSSVRARTSEGAVIRYLHAVLDLDVFMDKTPVSDVAVSIVRSIASSHGLRLSGVPADLSQWRDAMIDTVVTEHRFSERFPAGGEKCPETVTCRAADGREWHLAQGRDYHRGFSAVFPGERLRLTLKGVTSGHGGYVSHVEDIEVIETKEWAQAYLDRHDRVQREGAAFAALRSVDSSGQEILRNDAVRLQTSCLEASEGTMGHVVEVLGDMAIVKFRGRRKTVPCYGHALARLARTPAGEAMAANCG